MQRLKSLRIVSGMSREDFGKALNISFGTVAAYEQGIRVPPVEKIIEIANYFNVTADYLIGNDNKAVPVLENKKIPLSEKIEAILKEIKEEIIKDVEDSLRDTFMKAIDVEIREEIREVFKQEKKTTIESDLD